MGRFAPRPLGAKTPIDPNEWREKTMRISMIRIDERLIHGQVTMGWARTSSANLILALNDLVSQDPFQKKLMMMAAPVGAPVEIYSLAEFVEKLNANAWPNATSLVLLRNPVDMVRLVEAGVKVTKVNVGGVRSAGATIKLTKEVTATPEELAAWKKLDEAGIRIEVQWVPGAGVTVLNDILRKH
jgi:mannose/fructose/N-acetylgalactosamine-specific phosphotransferase system component IIB